MKLLAVFVFSGVATLSVAQTNQGIIAGTVTDSSGALVDGAKISAVNVATGVTSTAQSSGGSYRFPGLAVGRYDLTVTATGFQTAKQTGVEVLVANTTAVNFVMTVGSVTESVVVSAGSTGVQSESSDVGTVIESRQVVELPLALGGVGAMRSPEAFMFLAPGVTGPGTANSNNGIFISKTGAGQNFGNEVLLDGASTLRAENGSSFDEAGPSVEALREFKILTATFPAEYDHTTGGVESFTTKSGTNVYHGTAFEILKNEVFNANFWFDNARGQARPIDKKHDYGLNLGGPVRIPKLYNGKDKTFFFFNWEQYRENAGGSPTSTVLTDAARSGNLSAYLTNVQVGTNPCDGTPIFQGQIFDPLTTKTGPNGTLCRTAFTGNIIPANRTSKVSQNFLTYMPVANAPGIFNANGVVANNYIFSAVNPLFNTTYQFRIDENISDLHKVYFSYHARENTRYSGQQVAPAPIDPGGWPQDFITHYLRAGWDYTISPNKFNLLNIGWNRTNSINVTSAVQQANAGDFSWAEKLGIGNITGAPGRQFPNVGMGESILGLGRGNQDDLIDGGFRFNEQFTWSKGKHTIGFGADVRTQLFSPFNLGTDSGNYTFGRAQTAATQTLTSTTGNGIASFLLGDLGSAGRQITGHVARWTQQYYAGYVKDDWKVRSNLTINIGLRYNLDVPRKESRNDTSNFDPTVPNPAAGGRPGALVFGTNCGSCNPRWAETYKKAWAPRVGFAYTARGKFVVRGGYGIYYSPLQYTDFGGRMQQGFSSSPALGSVDNFTRAFNWDAGFPNVPQPPSLDPTQLNGQFGMDYVKPEYGQPGKIQSWSIQIQRQVTGDMVATVGYVGQRSDHLRSAIDNVNNIPWDKTALGDQLLQNINGNTAGVPLPYAGFTGNVQQALRPFPQYQWIYTDVLQNRGTASYDSLQATLERRFAAGLQAQVSFTWQKTITDSDSLLPGINGGIAQVQNPQNLSLDRSVSSQDVPLMFVASFIYELPFGPGKHMAKTGVPAALFGGWQIGGVFRYQSGVPTTFCGAQGIPGWDQCIRFDRVAGQQVLTAAAQTDSFDPFKDRQFNRAAFADPNAGRTGNQPFRLGNFPRNNTDARTWGYRNEDFSLIRNFRIREPIVFQLKAEFLNAFNRHIFSAGNQSPNDPNFGLVNGTIDTPRNIQFTFRVNF